MQSDDIIRKADDVFVEIFREFLLFHFINPTNRTEEKERFLEAYADGQEYNPCFTYHPLPADLPKWRRNLESLVFGPGDLHQAYAGTRQELMQTLDLAKSRGTDEITTRSRNIFGSPTPELVREADQLLNEVPAAEEETKTLIGVKELMERLRNRLRDERIEGWTVVEDPSCVPLAQIDWAHHRIRLQSGMIVPNPLALRLADHLVEVHIYRAANGERQPYRTFAVGFAGHLETEEGLAIRLEERNGHLNNALKRRYAGRVLAAAQALDESFFDIFQALVKRFDPEDAYSLTERSKRGLQDTSQAGGFIQDHIFWAGQKKVAALSDEDLRMLYIGKIGLSHLPLARRLLKEKRLMEPAFLPDSLHG